MTVMDERDMRLVQPNAKLEEASSFSIFPRF